jgi:hypothetical protein
MFQSNFKTTASRYALLLSILFVAFQSLVAQSLEEKIKALPDIISVEKMEQNPFFSEAYIVNVKQPLDHRHPEKGFFPQRVFVSHLSYEAPVVFVTEGYGGDRAAGKRYIEELSPILNANQLFVEHRFFGKSRPDTIHWVDLTVENAAADQHHVVQLFKQLYTHKWVSTGISKGGETVLYHRMLYPDDVEASVPFVAPLNFSTEEQRHPHFIEKEVGTKYERKKVKGFQMEVLRRKDQLMPFFEKLCKDKKYTFRAPLREIFDYDVLEYSFSFWQWGTSVKTIPSLNATDKEIFDHFQKISSCSYFDIESGKSTEPFFVQALMQLGYYAYDAKPFKMVMETKDTRGYIARLFLDKDQVFPYNPQMSNQVDKYLKSDAKKVMLIYGEIDPWSASAATGDKNPGVVKIVQPRGSHRSRIGNMPEPLKKEAIDLIMEWMK